MIDLRSDTVTQPTAGMRAAIASAVVGDEQEREDPTVLELERRGAALLGQEEAVFVPTATMANEIALRILAEPGDELLAEQSSHVLIYEQGGPAALSGLVMRGLPGRAGRLAPEQIVGAIRDWRSGHSPRTRIVSIESAHNSSGGRVWLLDELDAVVGVCREHDLRVHLDGARVANAAVALGVPVAEIGRPFDTVTLCLSKGLGCPLGALVAGSPELMTKARRAKHLFGGAMRQAGMVAAAGVYAFDHHLERIADDHRRARFLAERLAAAGLPVDPERVETNFVQIDVGALGLAVEDALARVREEGVALSDTIHATRIRAVTHLDVSDEDIEEASEAIPRALGVLARA
ncbi:MAG TPA: GntG family PLP-dependent aldolase [Gaiellaceae bacterium]